MPKVISLVVVLFISNLYIFPQQNDFKIIGNVSNSETSEPLPNCNVVIVDKSIGTITDSNGNYQLLLPKGKYEVQFSYLGFETQNHNIELNETSKTVELNITLKPSSILEKEITVTGVADDLSTVSQKIISKDIHFMPTINKDVLRSVQVLAGVTTNNELSSGYNVRGGSFDENLIYLNGFEIYRPFLLKQGVEESQTLINPDLVSDIKFYNGGFPSKLGDRMSSALEVNYNNTFEEKLNGTVRADLMNLGVAFSNNYKNINWQIGARYAYPDAFLQKLQTTGDYNSSFSDIQFAANYKINSRFRVDLLALHAQNKFFLEPESWIGHFGGFSRGDIRQLKINYDGRSEYKYLTTLAGLKTNYFFNDDIKLSTSISLYKTDETESKNLTGHLFYNYDPVNSDPASDEYLKSRYETSDNKLSLNSIRMSTGIEIRIDKHLLTAGVEYRLVELINNFNETYSESGDSTLLQQPMILFANKNYNLNNLSFFINDEIKISEKLNAVIGIRFLHYGYSKENLISPRINLSYEASPISQFSLGWGYYYQPPFINELKNPELGQLKSQRAIHYTLGWNYKFKPNFTFFAEAYYKDLDNLIPFYFDELKMIYTEGNIREGYAYGLDLQIDGELIEDMRSIFGYSYLNSYERTKGTTEYKRRLLDQTHTIQIFLQDKIKNHPNWQSHLRFLFGSGLLYYNRIAETDTETGNKYIAVDIEYPQEYFLYFRVDMGLSASFDLFDNYKLIAVAEVLNVFNHLNYGSYDWVQVFEQYNTPIRIPRVLSKRFFNIRFEFRF